MWTEQFEANADRFLDHLADVGPTDADLNRDFAAPVAAQNLINLLGFRDVAWADLARWSIDFTAGIGNVLDDPEIWARSDRAIAEVDAVLDELLPHLRDNPDDSITSLLLHSGMPEQNVRNNVKLTISGGMNEPQHMVTAMSWALETHPDVRREVVADPTLWPAVFEETVRWRSPIGMIPRMTTGEIDFQGVPIPAEINIGLSIASANRDSNHFDNRDGFDIHRPHASHLAFGHGTHQCAGFRAARISIGQVAVPRLYERFPGLRVDESRQIIWAGWVFRGITALPVSW